MASLFDGYAKTVLSTLQGVFGETATFKAGGTGTPKTITVITSIVPPQIIVSDDHGQQSDRVLYFQVAVADVPTPARGDTYDLSSPSNTGRWTHMRVEKQNNARWLIAARLMTHGEIAGAGAQEVRG